MLYNYGIMAGNVVFAHHPHDPHLRTCHMQSLKKTKNPCSAKKNNLYIKLKGIRYRIKWLKTL